MTRFTIGCLLCLLIMTAPVLAQTQPKTFDSPIILRFGDLWLMDGDEPLRLTHYKSIDNVVVSPDGTRIAFTVLADMSAEAIQQTSGYGGGTLPNDLWVLDITTGETKRISGQPDNAIFPPENASQIIGVAHSIPTWSPDGCCLGWGEEYQHPQDHNLRQVVYDLALDERRVIFQPNEQYGVPGPLSMEWGEVGMLIHEYQWDEKPIHFFHVYNWITRRITTIRIEDKIVIDYGWIRDDGKSFIGVRFNDNDNWFRYDPYNGDIQAIPYPIEYYSPADPQQSFGIIRTDFGWESQGQLERNEYIFIFYYTEDFALSPDGHAIVYRSGPQQYQLYQLGADISIEFEPIPGAIRVFWGTRERRVRYPDEQKTVGLYECLDNDGVMFAVGDRGRVLTGDPNVLRMLPGVYARRIGLLPAGTEFTIVSGPLCRNGFTWWRVELDGVIGWTTEGSGVNKWLERIGDASS